MQTASQTQQPTAQQRRLKGAVKRLVIELGYLESVSSTIPQAQAAAELLDSAIDKLNQPLSEGASE